MNDKNKEEVVEVSSWMEYVTEEVLSLLRIFLPVSKSGNIGIKYRNPVVASYEDHEEIDESKADAVAITLVFDFEEPIDIPKEIELEEK
jgi:hypothetical protein